MPPFSRHTARLCFLYLTLATGLEAVRWTASSVWDIPIWPWHRAIVHLFFVGGVMQIIFSVAYWMFPTPRKDLPRGSLGLAYASLVALNLGLLLRAVVEPILFSYPMLSLRILLVCAAWLQWLGILLFLLLILPRLQPRPKKQVEDARS